MSERYLITVLNDRQHPLLDARVRIYDGQQQLFEGRTYAGGQTIFLPRASSASGNTAQFRIVAEYGNQQAETTVSRRTQAPTQESIELVVAGSRPPEDLHLDILFLLDTTGSMGDELGRIQETIDSIAQRIDALTPRPILRFGLVAYRDREDAYVTRSYDFTPDVSSFRQQLNSFSADGGGDTPESLNEGLHEAVQGVRWDSENAVRLIFLVADAGPHLDYEQDYDYANEIQQAVAGGIKIYPIAASNTDDFAEYVFRQLAQQTLGRFIFLTYQPGESSGTPGESTTLQSGDQPYTVEQLDDLIVQVVQRELAMASGQE
ncbi:MAG: VWA domain-containing protein [Chloroflexaceae bacterium]|nr:VWA domain-containing protein [Chloroflexaceae bacterium]